MLYVSNLLQTASGSAEVGSDSWIAQEFFTGNDAGAYTLNSIQLLMNAASGSPNGFSLSIYDILNTAPNNNLGNLVGPDPSAGGVFTYTTSGITLAPSSIYFVVAISTTPVAQGAYVWSKGGQYAIGNGSWEIYQNYFTSSDGSSWTRNPVQNAFQMAIIATPIPEPGVLGLLGLGGLALLWHRRKVIRFF